MTYRDEFWKALYIAITGGLVDKLECKVVSHGQVVSLTDNAWGAGIQALARAPHSYPDDDSDYPCVRCGQAYDGNDPYGECLADEKIWKSIREQANRAAGSVAGKKD